MATYGRVLQGAPERVHSGRAFEAKSWISIDTGWSFLEDQFLSLVGTIRLKRNPTKLPVIKAYTMVFDLCQQGHTFGQMLYSRLEIMMASWLRDDLLPRFRGPVLSQFQSVFDEFVIVQKYLSCVFNYLNQFHVKREQCLIIEQLCLSCFHSIVFSEVKDDLNDAIKAEISKFRFECVSNLGSYGGDFRLLKAVVECIVGLSSLPDNSKCNYEEFLSGPAIRYTESFYDGCFANDILSNIGTSAYLIRVSAILKSEMSFFQQWLLEDTCASISSRLYTNLLIKPFSIMVADENEGFNVMFKQRSQAELSLVYNLYQGDPASLDMLAILFQDDVVEKGKFLANERDVFIENAITLRISDLSLIESAFNNSIRFHRALHDAFEFILESATNSAQLICNYVTKLLQSRDQDMHTSHLVALVCCLRQEKDIFSIHFRNSLANRLLGSEKVDTSRDKAFVDQLRDVLSKGFTHRMDVMISDVTRHVPLSCDYDRIHFTARILTTGCWPQSLVDNEKAIVIPSAISAGLRALEEQYKRTTIGRRITWINSAANCLLKGNCFRSKPILHLSVIQAVILLLFNHKETFIIHELPALTGLSLPMIKRALRHMCTGKHNILLKNPPSSYSIKDMLTVNHKFSTPQSQIWISMGAEIAINNDELRKSLATIEEGRKHILEACAVKIMKAKKTILLQELKAGIVEKTGHRFQCDEAMLNDIITGLVSREYLSRDASNADIVHYNPE